MPEQLTLDAPAPDPAPTRRVSRRETRPLPDWDAGQPGPCHACGAPIGATCAAYCETRKIA